MSVFHRLHPRLQGAIVSQLGWSSLRPVQEQAGEALLAGHNAVILAPTAGGKTEASVFPTLSGLLHDQPDGLGALYIAPIKALLNNQADRLGLYTEMVGLRHFVWHGDVGASARRRFLREPATLLMTTPESLEVMLVSQKVDAAALFRDLRVVVIDEIHALAGNDRGSHLLSVLERIVSLSRHDIQRIGLSATVGNPREILSWIQGTSQRDGSLVNPPVPPRSHELLILHRDSREALAQDAARVARGRKSLFFCETRTATEAAARRMQAVGVEVFVHHSSISKEERARAEELFHQGGDACIACTSTLELGIDIGDLDRVIQAEAPDTVSSFLQRMGRTGRRAGKMANTMFLCHAEESVLQALAIIALARDGWVESVELEDRCWPVFIHQLLTMSLAEHGVGIEAAWRHLSGLADFSGIRRVEYDRLLRWMQADGGMIQTSGRLVMGPKAEKRFGRRNYMDLYAVFSTPALYRVHTLDGREIGTLSQDFVDRLVADASAFLLGGQAWLVFQLNHKDKIVTVQPAPKGKEPTWGGYLPQFLSFELCQKIRELLLSEEDFGYLHPSARVVLEQWRAGLGGNLRRSSIELDGDEAHWWTFAGGRVNSTLRYALQAINPDWKVIPGNLELKIRGGDLRLSAIFSAIEALRDPEFWEDESLWRAVMEGLPSYRLSKFQLLMPPWMEREILARFLLDLAGAWRFLTGVSSADLRLPEPLVEERILPRSEPVPQEDTSDHGLLKPSNPIEYITEQEAFEKVCAELGAYSVIALDVETTIGRDQRLCLLQLGVPERSVLIDTLAIADLEPLRPLLESPKITKLIHYSSFEKSVLRRYGFEIAQIYDTHKVSKRLRGKEAGGHSLKAVTRRELGVDIDKENQCSDWSQRPLRPDQIDYAALDVELLLRLHEIFTAEEQESNSLFS